MSVTLLSTLARRRHAGEVLGVTSVCSAHPWVIEASLKEAGNRPVLIEATCNQVNQEGGYTGMTPADFRDAVRSIAEAAGADPTSVIFGGDHLGPNPWKGLDAEAAMSRASDMVAAYVEAGFVKIHLDASMGCRGEPAALGDAIVAERAAHLAKVAEAAAARSDRPSPLYVIGTEVPTPGGAGAEAEALQVTRAENAVETIAKHRDAFAGAGVASAFDRVIALVVQPGVEFSHDSIHVYEPAKARGLARVLEAETGLVFEAHSTDYQPPELLRALVQDGFAILKVGPALTFAMREALYGLQRIANELKLSQDGPPLRERMEALMIDVPDHWQGHYGGSAAEQKRARHESYSDRIRYYWSMPRALAAVDALLAAFGTRPIPEALIAQWLPQVRSSVEKGRIASTPKALVIQAIQEVLSGYSAATIPRAGDDRPGEEKGKPHASVREKEVRAR